MEPSDEQQANAAQDALDALTLMAGVLEHDGYPLQALQCYIALLAAANNMAPAAEARARLATGRLLLSHTGNTKEAHKELLRAVRAANVCACTPRQVA